MVRAEREGEIKRKRDIEREKGSDGRRERVELSPQAGHGHSSEKEDGYQAS